MPVVTVPYPWFSCTQTGLALLSHGYGHVSVPTWHAHTHTRTHGTYTAPVLFVPACRGKAEARGGEAT